MAAAEDDVDPMKGQKGVPPAALKAKEEYFRSPEDKRVAAHIDFYGPPRAKGPLPHREFSSISDHPEDIERRKNEHKRSPYGELEETALETTAHFTETEEDSIRQNKACELFGIVDNKMEKKVNREEVRAFAQSPEGDDCTDAPTWTALFDVTHKHVAKLWANIDEDREGNFTLQDFVKSYIDCVKPPERNAVIVVCQDTNTNGYNYKIRISKEDTVLDLKKKIFQPTGMPVPESHPVRVKVKVENFICPRPKYDLEDTFLRAGCMGMLKDDATLEECGIGIDETKKHIHIMEI